MGSVITQMQQLWGEKPHSKSYCQYEATEAAQRNNTKRSVIKSVVVGDITQNICNFGETAKRVKECDLLDKCLCLLSVQCCGKIKTVRERGISSTLVLYSLRVKKKKTGDKPEGHSHSEKAGWKTINSLMPKEAMKYINWITTKSSYR